VKRSEHYSGPTAYSKASALVLVVNAAHSDAEEMAAVWNSSSAVVVVDSMVAVAVVVEVA